MTSNHTKIKRPWNSPASQGGVISPLMCNVYLYRLDQAWDEHDGILVRYADDLLVMCFSRSQVGWTLARLVELLEELGLRSKTSKTRIVHLATDGEGVDFLGFHHRQVCSRGLHGLRRAEFLARWPSNRTMQHARDRVRGSAARRRLPLRPEAIVEDVNVFHASGWRTSGTATPLATSARSAASRGNVSRTSSARSTGAAGTSAGGC